MEQRLREQAKVDWSFFAKKDHSHEGECLDYKYTHTGRKLAPPENVVWPKASMQKLLLPADSLSFMHLDLEGEKSRKEEDDENQERLFQNQMHRLSTPMAANGGIKRILVNANAPD